MLDKTKHIEPILGVGENLPPIISLSARQTYNWGNRNANPEYEFLFVAACSIIPLSLRQTYNPVKVNGPTENAGPETSTNQ